MKYPYELKIFSVILLSTFLIFSSSHFGVLAFEGIISKAKGFPENTWIGPLDVSGLEKTEANEQLLAKVTEWQMNSTIQISYKEINGDFPISDIYFKVDESVQVAKDSTKNEIIIELDDTTLQATLTSLSSDYSKTKVDMNLLENELITKISTLQTGIISINVEDYLTAPTMEDQVVHTIKIPIVNEDLKNIGATLNIEPKATFSLLQFLEGQGLTSLDNNVINVIASGVYQAVLPTNFEILERHIGVELPEHTLLGFEAKLDSKLKRDLLFYNPNNDNYKIEIYNDGQFLIFDVVGAPFLYEYTIMQEGLQQFNPKIIKQFNPLLEPGQSKITRNGQKGYYLEVSRLILDETGKLIEQQLMSKDYYSPVHQVEVVGLGTKESDLNVGNTGTNVIPEDIANGSTDAEVPVDIITPEEPNTSIKDTEQEPLWGRPDEIGK
jgi:hypothetical protein